MCDKIKTLCSFLNQYDTNEYLSLIYYFSDKDIKLFDKYILDNNINDFICKINLLNQVNLSNSQENIINNLNSNYLKYYILIYNFYIENSNDETYLKYLNRMQDIFKQKLIENNININDIKNEENLTVKINEMEVNLENKILKKSKQIK
jgi:hypothetical protein